MHVFTCVYIEAQHLLLSQWLWHVCGTKTLTKSYISPFTCPGSLLQYGLDLRMPCLEETTFVRKVVFSVGLAGSAPAYATQIVTIWSTLLYTLP